MKKIIIGLLIAAAGAGAFFVFRKKKITTGTKGINKEWIIGQWTPVTLGTDTVIASDSNFSKTRFDFQKDGNIIRTLNDSVIADTSHYQWNKANELVWKEKPTDSSGKSYVVTQLTKDSLRILAADSTTVLFIKTK